MHVGRLAQLARASRLHREGQGFESLSAHHINHLPQGRFFICLALYTSLVYAMCMSRTNIDLPDDDIAELMRRFDLPTKKSAVEFALKRVLEMTDQMKALDDAFGIGWDGDVNALRQAENGMDLDEPKISA